MILHGIGLLPLSENLRKAVLDLVQPWCANNLAISGKCLHIARALDFFMEHGSTRGYFPKLEKSVLVTTSDQANHAASQLEQFRLVTTSGCHYLGSFIGP